MTQLYARHQSAWNFYWHYEFNKTGGGMVHTYVGLCPMNDWTGGVNHDNMGHLSSYKAAYITT